MDSNCNQKKRHSKPWYIMEAEWLERRRSQVQIPFWPLADVVLGSPKFNFSAGLVNSQLVCLLSVGILNLVMFIWKFIYHCLFVLVLKSPANGEWPIKYTFLTCTALSLSYFQFPLIMDYSVSYFQAVFQTCFTKWGHPPIGCSSTVLSSLLGRTGVSALTVKGDSPQSARNKCRTYVLKICS